jgi:hypothetical protein
MIPVVLRDVDLPFSSIDMDSGPVSLRWTRAIDLADNNNQVDAVINAIILSQPGNETIKAIRDEFKKQEFESILKRLHSIIRSKNCVLFLGPEVLNCRNGNVIIPFYKHLANEFIKLLDENKIFFDTEQRSNLSYLIDRYETWSEYVLGMTENFVKDVFDKATIDETLFNLLENFDFPLIINTNPDTRLSKLFPEKYLNSYYNFSDMSPIPLPEPDRNSMQRLVYNVYGSFENEYSIVLNEKDLVDYTKTIYEKNPQLPRKISERVERCYGLFVGFNFHDWHLKILFDVLDLQEKPDNYSISDFSSFISENQKEYFERQFKMTFIKNGVLEFFNELQNQP